MCLIAVAWQAHARYQLALIANRDEFHDRPASAAACDPLHPDVYGGRDLQAGGSWLLASTRGRLAAVTNVRDGLRGETAPRSRGTLVHGFVAARDPAAEHLGALAPTVLDYGRFNLLAWDGSTLQFASNHPRATTHAVPPGLHAMSNGAFDARWPKSGHATRALAAWLDSPASRAGIGDATLAPLFEALADTTPAPDADLPDTGVGLELERMLSPPFVRGSRYGTRCSTVVLVEADRITFAEHRFGPDAAPIGDSLAVLPRSG